jgi:alkaline phosphatase D
VTQRRHWLGRALGLGAASLATACTGIGALRPGPQAPTADGPWGPTDPAGAAPWRGADDPFTLGVASGWPRPDGATLWTRLAPQPMAPDGGMGPEPVAVRWAVHEDDAAAAAPVRSGVAASEPGWAHSVRIELTGLRAHRRYRYRFASGAATSAVGRFRTAPAPGEGDRLRLVFASCQQYEQGWYAAWRHAVADDPDLVLFLGDYIYESSWGRRHVRRHDPGTPEGLDAYRRRHALYRSDPDLQAAHAACAWALTWDDHEVDNDYAGDLSARGEPPALFRRRRMAAYRAYFEHMPMPWSMAPRGATMRIHGALDWGGLARVHLLDDRQYRSPQACSPPGHAGSRTVGPECAARLDPARTLLGAEQEAWLAASMRGSRAGWNLLAQQTLIGPADSRPGPAQGWWTDGWDGYPAARRRLIESVRASGAHNPIALGGDVHAFYAGELHEDFDRPAAQAAMLEFVGGAITSQTWGQARIDQVVAENRNLHYGEGRWRGYARMDLDRRRAQVAMRGIDDPADPATGCRTLRSFEVVAGSGRLDG